MIFSYIPHKKEYSHSDTTYKHEYHQTSADGIYESYYPVLRFECFRLINQHIQFPNLQEQPIRIIQTI